MDINCSLPTEIRLHLLDFEGRRVYGIVDRSHSIEEKKYQVSFFKDHNAKHIPRAQMRWFYSGDIDMAVRTVLKNQILYKSMIISMFDITEQTYGIMKGINLANTDAIFFGSRVFIHSARLIDLCQQFRKVTLFLGDYFDTDVLTDKILSKLVKNTALSVSLSSSSKPLVTSLSDKTIKALVRPANLQNVFKLKNIRTEFTIDTIKDVVKQAASINEPVDWSFGILSREQSSAAIMYQMEICNNHFYPLLVKRGSNQLYTKYTIKKIVNLDSVIKPKHFKVEFFVSKLN